MANNITGASLAPIYNRLNQAPQYHPVEAETFSDWAIEAGDIVTISRGDDSYESPVHSTTMMWKGAPKVNINASGNEKREPVAKIGKRKYNSGSGGYRTQQGLYSDIWSEDGHFHSVISQTSSVIYAYVDAVYDGMSSGLEMTASTLRLYVDDRYNSMASGLDMTSSSLSAYVNDRYNNMAAGLRITSSNLSAYVDDKYNSMASGLDMTASSISAYVDNKYANMSAGLSLTSSSLSAYVESRYNNMKSGLNLTSSSLSAYVESRYNNMKAGLNLTSSSLSAYVESSYNNMKSGLNLTSSSLSAYVETRYSNMRSGLNITSSTLSAYVDDKYNDMAAGLALTSSSAALYARNRTTSAQIIARINEAGASEALIGAEHVQISGTTKINDVFTITNDSLLIKSGAMFGTGDSYSFISGPNVTASYYSVRGGGNVRFSGSGSSEYYDLTSDVVKTMIKKAEVDGNTLKLTPVSGEIITFSKAVTDIGYTWLSGGRLRVTASPQGFTKQLLGVTVTDEGTSAWSNNVYSGKILYYEGSDDETTYETKATFTINGQQIYQNGWNAARNAETRITMTRGAYDEYSRTYTCTCTLSQSLAPSSTFYLYAR